MQLSRFRFTIGTMMVATAILGVSSWIIAGLVRDGPPWFLRHAIVLLVALPLLFSMTVTLVVTLVQRSLEGRGREPDDAMDADEP